MICNILGTCIVAMGLTHVDIGERDPLKDSLTYFEPFTGQYTETFDVKELFTPEERPWSVAGTIITRDNVKIDLGYSNGIDTAKLDVTPGYTVGVTKLIEMGNHRIAVGASTTFGGKQKHSPCIASYHFDGYESQHACVQGLPEWDSYEFPEHKQPYNVSLRYSYKF